MKTLKQIINQMYADYGDGALPAGKIENYIQEAYKVGQQSPVCLHKQYREQDNNGQRTKYICLDCGKECAPVERISQKHVIQGDWEAEFDKEFDHDSGDEYNDACPARLNEQCNCQIKDIKQFIRTLLAKREAEVRAEERERCVKIIKEIRQKYLDMIYPITELFEALKEAITRMGGEEKRE